MEFVLYLVVRRQLILVADITGDSMLGLLCKA